MVPQSHCVSNFKGKWYVGGPNTYGTTMGLVAPAQQRALKDQIHRTRSHTLLLPPLFVSQGAQTLNTVTSLMENCNPLVRCF